MSDVSCQENKRMKKVIDLIRCYLYDQELYPSTNVIGLVAAYASTVPGQALLMGVTKNEADEIGRSALEQMILDGYCAGQRTGTSQTIKMVKTPTQFRGKMGLMGSAETAAKAVVMSTFEDSDLQVTLLLQYAVEKVLRYFGELPDDFPFAMVRRTVDRLVDQGFCERSFTAHEGRTLEVLTRHKVTWGPSTGKKGAAATEKTPLRLNVSGSPSLVKIYLPSPEVIAAIAPPTDGPTSTFDHEHTKEEICRAFGIPLPKVEEMKKPTNPD